MRQISIDFLIPYLKVLIVAIPLSIVSGVIVRSCETSRGAILATKTVCWNNSCYFRWWSSENVGGYWWIWILLHVGRIENVEARRLIGPEGGVTAKLSIYVDNTRAIFSFACVLQRTEISPLLYSHREDIITKYSIIRIWFPAGQETNHARHPTSQLTPVERPVHAQSPALSHPPQRPRKCLAKILGSHSHSRYALYIYTPEMIKLPALGLF